VRPMIWSDMYFRLGSKTSNYYDLASRIPRKIVSGIPRDVDLVYWDYYHEDRKFYKSHFTKHRELGHEPVMASGVWTWAKLWHQHHLTERKAGPCIEACRDAGVKELVFTMWGDDGGYCDFESAFTGLVWCAEKAFCTGSIDEKRVAGLFDSIYGGDYKAYKRAAEMNYSADAASILWDDPLMQLVLNHVIYTQKLDPLKAAASLKKLAKSLLKHEGDPELRHARIIAETTSMKLELIGRIRKAYERKDRKVMAVLGKEAIRVADQVDKLAESFRFMWLRHNKPFGLEGMQIRFAGQSERLRELKRRIDSFVKGKEAVIPEFEILIKNPQGGHTGGSYKQVSTASDWI